MKAIDIATRNHISIEDILEVCKELEISCKDGTTDLNEKDVFLIEKKIEVIKNKKAKLAEKSKAGKKIKLKRKVQVSRTIKSKQGDESKDKDKPKTKKKEAPEKTEGRPARVKKERPDVKDKTKVDDKKKPADKKKFDDRQKTGKPSSDKKRFDKKERTPGKKIEKRQNKEDIKKVVAVGKTEKASEALETKDQSKKRKKGKEKEKDKDFKKKFKKTPEEKRFAIKKKIEPQKIKKEAITPSVINITENVSVGELSKKLNVKAKEVIAKLMKLGVMATINQIIDADTAEILASEYGTEVKVVSLFDETVIRHTEKDKPEDYIFRPPVVTVMGHVDHGKTKLLDAIREANVIDSEHGGITQHLGAYTVDVNGKRITFLDTPGHAAFTTMRARGAKITDIVVLVVAANDGVMPQTIEAINHAKDAGVPIIVAINKIDLPDANIKKVRDMLTSYELIPEEWGGSTLFAEISAKQKINIEELLELILIQSEMLELKANPQTYPSGTVIESKLDPGRGSVSTILVQNGTLKQGSPFVIGVFSGKVRAMFDDKGKQINVAGPSTPVEIIGISGVPAAGDPFEGVESEKFAKQISQKRLEYKRIESAKKVRKVTLESLNDMIKEGEVQELRIIVKADVDGSSQALKEGLEKLSTDEIRVKVIHIGTGGINESDVMLASASNAIIIGYHVRPTGKVADIAEKENVSIKFYNIIFEATDDIKAAMVGMLSPEIKEQVTGTGEIVKTFKVSKIGTIAGAILQKGKLARDHKMRLIRGGVVIFDGEMKSLKRFKDDVASVDVGQEFGFGLENFNDIKESDTFEAYKHIEIAKTL